MAGMSHDLGQYVPGSEKLHARKLWTDFSLPISAPVWVIWSCKSLGDQQKRKAQIIGNGRKTGRK